MIGGIRENLEKDLAFAIDNKIAQIDSTIRRLIDDEHRLTGVAALPRRRYVPLLILTEGFPTNPGTWDLIGQRIRGLGLLDDPRIGPFRIIDREEVYFIERQVELGESAIDELVEHANSGMHAMAFKDFLYYVKKRDLSRPERLESPMMAGFKPLRDAVAATEPPG